MTNQLNSVPNPDAQADVAPKDDQSARPVDNPKLARFLDRLDREMGRNLMPVAAE